MRVNRTRPSGSTWTSAQVATRPSFSRPTASPRPSRRRCPPRPPLRGRRRRAATTEPLGGGSEDRDQTVVVEPAQAEVERIRLRAGGQARRSPTPGRSCWRWPPGPGTSPVAAATRPAGSAARRAPVRYGGASAAGPALTSRKSHAASCAVAVEAGAPRRSPPSGATVPHCSSSARLQWTLHGAPDRPGQEGRLGRHARRRACRRTPRRSAAR